MSEKSFGMSHFLLKVKEFIKRDFYITASYRFVFIMNFVSIFISVAVFFFISQTFGSNSPMLRPYGGEYFPFIIIGIAFFNYIFTGLGAFSNAIRREQVVGTIEAMLVSPTKISTIIILTSIWSFIYSSLIVLIYLVFGSVFFNLTIDWMNFPVCLIILIPSIITFSSFGIISASFVMVFKKGDPIKWFFSMVSGFLSGTFFPIDVLPQGLQGLSRFIPTTYSLKALRLALLKKASFFDLLPEFLILVLFCVVSLPISIFIFKLAVKKVKKDGALAYY